MFGGMKYVYAVYQEKSFQAAAAKLYISQPSLSANIKHEEEAAGCLLFDRSTKPVTLTEQGRKYIEAAEKIMAAQQEFTDYLDATQNLTRGSIRIGGSTLFCAYVLPEAIAAFRKSYPHIDIQLTEQNTANLTRMCERGDIDLMIDNTPLDPSVFESTDLYSEHLLLAVPAQDPANDRLRAYRLTTAQLQGEGRADTRPVPMTAFRDHPFIMLKPENNTAVMASAIFSHYGMEPEILFSFDQQMTAYNAACSGIGICFISDSLIRHIHPDTQMVYYRLPESLSRRTIRLYCRKGRYRSRALNEFIRICSETVS